MAMNQRVLDAPAVLESLKGRQRHRSRPMDTHDGYWIRAENPEARRKWSNYPVGKTGKWMLFYDNENADAAWARAEDLFDAGQLDGIRAMKVSTNRPNPRASRSDNKVIIFYCGPSDDEQSIMWYGRNLLAKMGYTRQRSGADFPPFIYYKSDAMTDGGTFATGQKKNNLYRLQYE